MSVRLHTARVGERAESSCGDMGPDSFRFAGSTRTWAGQERETTPGSGHDPVPETSVSMLMCSNARLSGPQRPALELDDGTK